MLLRSPVVAEEDDVVRGADLGELPGRFLGRDDPGHGAAPVDVDGLQVRVLAEGGLRVVHRRGSVPLRRVLDHLEVRVRLHAAEEPVLTVEAVDRGEVALEHRDVTGAADMRRDVGARVLPVEHVVGADDHVDLALSGRDVHAHDGHVLARRVGEGGCDRGAVDRVDDQGAHALVDQRLDLSGLLAGVAVGRDRPDEADTVLGGGRLLERDVRAPEVGAVPGKRDADCDALLRLCVPLTGCERGRRQYADEPDDREHTEQPSLHRPTPSCRMRH